MRVKVGDVWYNVGINQPIMIELTGQDKVNISNMDVSATKYAIFANSNDLTEEQMISWMGKGPVSEDTLVIDPLTMDSLLTKAAKQTHICEVCEGDETIPDGLDEGACSMICPSCKGAGYNFYSAFKDAIRELRAECFPQSDDTFNIWFIVSGDDFKSEIRGIETTYK